MKVNKVVEGLKINGGTVKNFTCKAYDYGKQHPLSFQKL